MPKRTRYVNPTIYAMKLKIKLDKERSFKAEKLARELSKTGDCCVFYYKFETKTPKV